MSIADDGGYHGQEFVEGQDASDVPSINGNAIDALNERGPGSDISVYSRVVITGNYGLLCAQNQVVQYYDITLAQARKRKWDYFGVCPSVMTCYDTHGKPVHEE